MARRATIAAFAAASAAAVVLSGCAADNSSEGGDDRITLELSTFGDFGYTDELLAQFKEEYPNIDVVHTVAANFDDVRPRIISGLAAGSGLADVEALEVGWTAELKQYADQFLPASDENGPWVPVQTVPVTLDDGSFFAYGAAIGPSAVCYREDLFAEAGLPTDPEEVAALLEGGWDRYFEVGQQFVDAGGSAAWFDSAGGTYRAMIEQVEYAYEDGEGGIIADTNPEVKEIFYQLGEVLPSLSAGLASFEDTNLGMANGAFATLICPSWMLGIVEGNAPEVDSWRVANVFPGGVGNIGGAFLAVPAQTEHPEEAALLASWLTAPTQQIEAFKNAGAFPSRVEALDAPELLEARNAYFGDAPFGEIFSARAQAEGVVAYKGVDYSTINNIAVAAINRVDNGSQTIDESWAQFVSEIEELK